MGLPSTEFVCSEIWYLGSCMSILKKPQSRGQQDALEKEMATHSSMHTWGNPWTEGPGGLPSMGSQRVRHNLATK